MQEKALDFAGISDPGTETVPLCTDAFAQNAFRPNSSGNLPLFLPALTDAFESVSHYTGRKIHLQRTSLHSKE